MIGWRTTVDDEDGKSGEAGGPHQVHRALTSPDGLVTLFDRDLRSLIVDGSLLASVGGRGGAFAGRPVGEVLPPDLAAAVHACFSRALAGATGDVEFQFGGRFVHARAVPVRDERSEVFAGLGVIHDITERKRAEETLRASEVRLRTIIETEPECVKVVSGEGLLLEMNPAGLAMLEAGSLAEVQAHGLMNFIAPEHRAPFMVLHRHVMAGGTAVLEFEVIGLKGTRRWLETHAAPLRDASGRTTMLLGVTRDISGHKRAQAVLRESEERFRRLIHGLPAAIYTCDVHGRITMFNEAAAALWGREPVVGKDEWCGSWRILSVDGAPLERGQCPMAIALREGRPVRGQEIIIERPDGSRSHVLPHPDPIRDAAGAVVGAVNMLVDLTESRRADAALRASELQLRSFVEHAPAEIAMFDRGMICVAASRRWLDSYGGGPHRLVGRHYYEIHPELPERWKEIHRRALAGEPQSCDEDVWVQVDGSRHWMRWAVHPWRDAAGAIGGIILLADDITRRKHAEAALEENRLRLASIIDSAMDGIITMDDQHRIMVFNAAAERMFRCRFTDVMGKSISRFIPDWFSPGQADPGPRFNRGKLGSLGQFGDIRGQRSDGEEFPIEASISLLEFGGNTLFTVTLRDLTERKRAEERMLQTQKMNAIGQLAGGVAHDFNNQLAAILGFAELLASRVADPELKRYAGSIITAAQRSGELTRNLLAFARQGQFQSVRLDVHQLIAETTELLERSIDKRISIVRRLEARPSSIIGDPAQIQNALLNLALNARDAMPMGGSVTFATTVVEMDAARSERDHLDLEAGRYLRVTVSDTGAGMSDEVRRHIFEPFFTTKPVGKGTGMGLASVYGTVQGHGGAITVHSQPERGTVFDLYLPLAAPAKEAPARAASAAPRTAALCILMVDDEALLRDVICDLLTDDGHTVLQACNGREAVAIYEQRWREIDVVILDMVMPIMGGRETFLALRRINPAVRAMLSSGYSANGETQAMLDDGVLGFLQKPYSKQNLDAMIAQVAGPRKQ
jgi:PAS domain S-box-containing protein